MDNCIFCKLASGSIPTQVVYQDEAVFAFRDNSPQAPVHILLIPKRHIASLAEADDALLLGKIMLAAATVAKQEGIDESGYRVVTNRGRDAGQSVFHLHFHLLGGRALGWPPG